MKSRQQQAEERASVILQVRSGQITASEGARLLGLSRKTYYQWEKRGLEALVGAVEERPPGRPPKTNSSREQVLEARIAHLETELQTAQDTADLRALLLSTQQPKEKNRTKKKQRR